MVRFQSKSLGKYGVPFHYINIMSVLTQDGSVLLVSHILNYLNIGNTWNHLTVCKQTINIKVIQ